MSQVHKQHDRQPLPVPGSSSTAYGAPAKPVSRAVNVSNSSVSSSNTRTSFVVD